MKVSQSILNTRTRHKPGHTYLHHSISQAREADLAIMTFHNQYDQLFDQSSESIGANQI
jgi:hypothetical protein